VADIPSIFTKVDFYETLLPGYLVVLIYLFLFQPTLLSVTNSASFDFLTAVIFLVAGPVVGLSLKQALDIAVRGLWTRRSKTKKDWLFRYNNALYFARLRASDSERSEVDRLEAEYEFDISGGAGLVVLGAAHAVVQVKTIDIVSLLILGGGILLLMAQSAAFEEWGYAVQALLNKYPLPKKV